VPTEADLQRLVSNFASEAKVLCEKAAREVLALERPENAAAARRARDDLARHVHTLKGSAATLGLSVVKEIAHRLEALVEAGEGALEAEAVDLALRALDTSLARVRAAAAGEGPPLLSAEPLLAALEAARERSAGGKEKEPTPRPAPPPADLPPSNPEPEDDSWRVSHAHVSSLGGVAERLRELRLRVLDRRREARAQLDAMELKAPSPLEVRALLERVDQVLGTFADDTELVAGDLDDALKGISTLPVSTVLETLQRTARDAARATGKEAQLSAVGGELMVDRRLLDALRGPLIHLVRNAVDHGLEPGHARERAGKSKVGAVVIRTELRGNQVVFEVSDDGAGLNHKAIRTTAVQRGLMGAAEVEALSSQALEQLIFRPGFSTRQDASELSGRGVGLDVVATQVRRLGGTVAVRSVAGQGMQIRLLLPSRGGSVPVLPLAVGEVMVGLPVASVESVSRVALKDIHRTARALYLALEGQMVPLQDLGGLLRVRHPVVLEEQRLVVARHLATRFALVVDDVREHQDLAIRMLPEEVRSLAAYQGLAALAGGALLPVLEPSWVATAVAGREMAIPDAGEGRALVVDDSLTARALHRAILEAAGFQVHLAASGAQALEHLRRARYDAVVCDLSMAEMDGVQLTCAVREAQGGASVPLVVVSAQESEAVRARALAAGADAFLTKRECAAGKLATEVVAVIARRQGAA
jgi:chemotaxis protein histidine kinase CheA/CheY-like chemotaxis protein